MFKVPSQYILVCFIMLRNSCSFISPSPSLSNSSIIAYNSSSERFSPSSLATLLRFLKLILPVLSSSNSLKALRISSTGSLSLIFDVIISKKSWYSIYPEPSLSYSFIRFRTSCFLTSNPSALIATLSSW